MSAAELMAACKRIDAAAAAVRVFVIGCQDGTEETDADNITTRQIALRGIWEVIAVAQKTLQQTRGGDGFNSLPLCFFAELVWTAEQALWYALGENGKGAPSNADLCELLGLALSFHADVVAARPALQADNTGQAGTGGKRVKGGAA